MIVFDDKGNWGFVTYGGGGGYFGVSASAGIQVQWTSADTIHDLAGPAVQSGGSVSLKALNPLVGVCGGAEFVQGVGDEPYYGVNLNIGIEVSPFMPFEVHGILTIASVDVQGYSPLIDWILGGLMDEYGEYIDAALAYFLDGSPVIEESPEPSPYSYDPYDYDPYYYYD